RQRTDQLDPASAAAQLLQRPGRVRAADQEAGGQPAQDDPRRRPALAPRGLERAGALAGLPRAAVDQLLAAFDPAPDGLEVHGAPACDAGAGASASSASSSSSSSPIPSRASCRRVACMPAWSKKTDTRQMATPVTTRLSTVQIANAASHVSPNRTSSAVSTPIDSSQADAPNTIATANHASARPSALRASARSADTSLRSARPVSSAESSVARPAAPIRRTLSSRCGGLSCSAPASPAAGSSRSVTCLPFAAATAAYLS